MFMVDKVKVVGAEASGHRRVLLGRRLDSNSSGDGSSSGQLLVRPKSLSNPLFYEHFFIAIRGWASAETGCSFRKESLQKSFADLRPPTGTQALDWPDPLLAFKNKVGRTDFSAVRVAYQGFITPVPQPSASGAKARYPQAVTPRMGILAPVLNQHNLHDAKSLLTAF
jgi:hypothetical protein